MVIIAVNTIDSKYKFEHAWGKPYSSLIAQHFATSDIPRGFTAMSNFIYNSYCVVHPGAEQITLTAAYRPVQAAEPAVARTAHSSTFIWASVAVLSLLAAFASAGEGAALLVGMLLWGVALVGWALSLAPVRRSLTALRQGLRAWKRSRRQAAEDERTWQLALQDARMMADLSRAMSAQAAR